MSLFCAFTVVYRSSRYSLSFPFWNFRVIQQSYLEHCQFVHHYHQHHNYPLYQNHHNINTNIIIAIITTSIYFITAISFALTITTIYIIITTIITTTPSFIIIIIISITAKKFSLLLLSLWVQWHFSTSASCNLTSFLFNVVLNFQNFQLKMFLVC